MKNIKIKSKSSASRCDICHQMDLFDPLNNQCLRCKDIVIPKPTKEIYNRNIFPTKPDWATVIFCLINIALMPFLAAFIIYLMNSSLSWEKKLLILFIVPIFLCFFISLTIFSISAFIKTKRSLTQKTSIKKSFFKKFFMWLSTT